MDIHYWDGAARGAAGALLALLGVMFGRDLRASVTARFGLVLIVGGLCYLVISCTPTATEWAWWNLPIQTLSVMTPGLFWVFVETWFDDEFELRWFHPLGIAAVAAPGLIHNSPWQVRWLGDVSSLFSLIAIGLGLWAALRGRNGDLVEARRRARLVLAIVIGGLIATVITIEAQNGTATPAWRLTTVAALTLLAMTLAIALLGWRDPGLLSPPARSAVEPGGAALPDEGPLLAAVENLMRSERLYRTDRLTVTAVASRLGVPEYRLRRAINQGSGARNFNAFLNHYRLDEVKAALIDPAQREVPILTMALDAGFGSLAPFNRAFKAATSLTPTAYRLRSLKAHD